MRVWSCCSASSNYRWASKGGRTIPAGLRSALRPPDKVECHRDCLGVRVRSPSLRFIMLRKRLTQAEEILSSSTREDRLIALSNRSRTTTAGTAFCCAQCARIQRAHSPIPAAMLPVHGVRTPSRQPIRRISLPWPVRIGEARACEYGREPARVRWQTFRNMGVRQVPSGRIAAEEAQRRTTMDIPAEKASSGVGDLTSRRDAEDSLAARCFFSAGVRDLRTSAPPCLPPSSLTIAGDAMPAGSAKTSSREAMTTAVA